MSARAVVKDKEYMHKVCSESVWSVTLRMWENQDAS